MLVTHFLLLHQNYNLFQQWIRVSDTILGSLNVKGRCNPVSGTKQVQWGPPQHGFIDCLTFRKYIIHDQNILIAAEPAISINRHLIPKTPPEVLSLLSQQQQKQTKYLFIPSPSHWYY